MKGSTRQIPGASFIWSCFVQNRAFILCPLKCDFRPLDIAWQPCVRLPRNIATRSRFYSRRSANTYPSLESDHKNDPYHGKTGQHALTSNKIFFSKSPVFAVHRGIVRHLPAEHKIQSLPVRIPPSPPQETLEPQWFQGFSPPCFPYFSPCGRIFPLAAAKTAQKDTAPRPAGRGAFTLQEGHSRNSPMTVTWLLSTFPSRRGAAITDFSGVSVSNSGRRSMSSMAGMYFPLWHPNRMR